MRASSVTLAKARAHASAAQTAGRWMLAFASMTGLGRPWLTNTVTLAHARVHASATRLLSWARSPTSRPDDTRLTPGDRQAIARAGMMCWGDGA